MGVNIFKAEKDALCFLGLMSNMYKYFDDQFIGPDKVPTHTHGLNIHALVVDNLTGVVLGLQQNGIHAANNPLLHAEQLTLKEAIEEKNILNPRDPATTSVETYYRNFLFNDNYSYDALKAGATIYTTLEPCPFCTGALLVSRMKRIVFVTPDSTYGNSFYSLWPSYYKKYDIHYEQMSIDVLSGSEIVTSTRIFLQNILTKINSQVGVPGTLYFDTMKPDLEIIYSYFISLDDKKLITTGSELLLNTTLLNALKSRIQKR